jgi:large subunit ribosomal protein L25
MLHTHSLKAEERAATGTGAARELRRRNMVPAIIYGANKPEVLFSVSEKEMTLQYRKQGFLSHMFDIEIGKKVYRALPKAIQLHPVTDKIEHMDFIHVNENEKIKINVTLHFINEQKCPGLKQGGVLNIIRHDLEVYCLPSNIPESIEINIEELNVGQSIHVSDIKLPKGVETKADSNIAIAALVSGKVASSSEEEATTEAAK